MNRVKDPVESHLYLFICLSVSVVVVVGFNLNFYTPPQCVNCLRLTGAKR